MNLRNTNGVTFSLTMLGKNYLEVWMPKLDRKEIFTKKIKALQKNKCWVHGDDLLISITEPFVGYPAEEIKHVDSKYPYHALYSHVGCMPLASGESQGQRTSMCPSCNREAAKYLDSLEKE